MRRCLPPLLALCLPLVAAAQPRVVDRFDCEIGLYDDPAATSRCGTITPGIPKRLYIGVRCTGAPLSVAGLEFSIAGLRPEDGLRILADETCPSGPIPCPDTLPAPADTSVTSPGMGGVNRAWQSCREAVILGAVQLLAVDSLTDHVLQVKRRYPPGSSEWRTPVVVLCDPPAYTPARVKGGCFVLNPSGTTPVACPTCTVAVTPATWSAVRSLYR